MDYPVLYRKRIIPEECIRLKDDIILSYENNILVTKWNALKPKIDLHHGYYCYFFDEGYKVSKFYKEDGTLMYYYCDIIDAEKKEEDHSIVVTDLLADVIVYPDGFVKVVDMDELVRALDYQSLTIPQLKKSLVSLNNLLDIIYSKNFPQLLHHMDCFESK